MRHIKFTYEGNKYQYTPYAKVRDSDLKKIIDKGKQYKMNVCFIVGEGRLHMFGKREKRVYLDPMPVLWLYLPNSG